nr:MAG TPA: hypothetical protein [Bacteriophage sp.]
MVDYGEKSQDKFKISQDVAIHLDLAKKLPKV